MLSMAWLLRGLEGIIGDDKDGVGYLEIGGSEDVKNECFKYIFEELES